MRKRSAKHLGGLANTDEDDAVELSVAASEALVIHELVKSDQLETTTILEAALCMSKARLERVCCTVDYREEEIDQSDSYSAFDDSVMLEAFQDVGLLCSIHEGEPICHVNVFEGGNCSHSESQDDNGGKGRKSADNLVQNCNGKLSSSRTTSGTRGVNDRVSCEASEEISEFTPPKKDNTDLLEELKHRDWQGIVLKPLVQETSFLSESEDIPLNKCFLVEKCEANCKLASQSSVNFGRFCEGADEVVSTIQDEGSYNLSLVDHFCSIVPCSISPENGVPFLDQDMLGVTETCFGSITNDVKEHLHGFPGVEIQPSRRNGQAVTSQSSSQRKSGWMKNYSRPALKVSTVTCAERENLRSLSLPMQSMLANPAARKENGNQKNHMDNTELLVGKENLVACHSLKSLQKVQSECEDLYDNRVRAKKRVRFSVFEAKQHQETVSQEQQEFIATGSKRKKYSSAGVLEKYLSSRGKHRKRSVFQGMEFLLTGFPKGKLKKLEQLISKHGGIVLRDIPSPSTPKHRRHSKSSFRLLPVILCQRKLQTTKFLYGCAVKTLILKPKWVTESISAGSVIPLEKYMILPIHSTIRRTRSGKPFIYSDSNRIFDGMGFMLCGKRRFCSQLSTIIKHGGGHVFRSLCSLIQSKDEEKIRLGAIISEDESRLSRHLRQCALEKEIDVMPASWIVKSLYSGSLLPTARE